jgi:hypothetical protein
MNARRAQGHIERSIKIPKELENLAFFYEFSRFLDIYLEKSRPISLWSAGERPRAFLFPIA